MRCAIFFSVGEIAAGGDKEGEEPYLETLHFFGVFDGHGGAEAALHCAQTLHQRIAEALAAHIDPEVEEHMAGEGSSFRTPLSIECINAAFVRKEFAMPDRSGVACLCPFG